jgi:hypothetical protein
MLAPITADRAQGARNVASNNTSRRMMSLLLVHTKRNSHPAGSGRRNEEIRRSEKTTVAKSAACLRIFRPEEYPCMTDRRP